MRGCACHKSNRLESAPIPELPDVTSATAAVCASDQSTNEIRGKAQFLLQMHERVASWLAVEIGFLDRNEADSQGFALPASLGQELQQRNTIRLQWWSLRITCIHLITALFDLTTHKSRTNIGLPGVALVRHDPP